VDDQTSDQTSKICLTRRQAITIVVEAAVILALVIVVVLATG
jgi:hypothetical protein